MASHILSEFRNPAAVSIGKFDGVHLGHRQIIKSLTAYKSGGLKAVVLGFERSPAAFFTGQPEGIISTHRQRERLLKMLGVDEYIIYPVTEESMGIDPEDFVRSVLVEKLHAKAVVAGEDCSFGKGGSGDMRLLMKLGDELGLDITEVKKLRSAKYDCEISSSKIREFIQASDMEAAAELLGRPYSFEGTVIRGRQIGRTLGMPTANIYPEDGRLLPPFGVYVSKVRLSGRDHRAITNIGMNPTVGGKKVSVESYIFDFDRDIYEEEISVSLLRFLRPEKKFANLEELKEQIGTDISVGMGLFSSHGIV